MAVQTTYAREHDIAYAGMIADMNPIGNQSKLNADSVSIGYGKGVVTSGEDGAVLPAASAAPESIIGVVQREMNRVTETDGSFAAPVDRDMTVVTHGIIWVTATATVVKDEPVFLRVGATNLGDFSNAAGTGATESVAIAGAKFLTGGATGELVKISLGLGG